jgi:hypothetical protein
VEIQSVSDGSPRSVGHGRLVRVGPGDRPCSTWNAPSARRPGHHGHQQRPLMPVPTRLCARRRRSRSWPHRRRWPRRRRSAVRSPMTAESTSAPLAEDRWDDGSCPWSRMAGGVPRGAAVGTSAQRGSDGGHAACPRCGDDRGRCSAGGGQRPGRRRSHRRTPSLEGGRGPGFALLDNKGWRCSTWNSRSAACAQQGPVVGRRLSLPSRSKRETR